MIFRPSMSRVANHAGKTGVSILVATLAGFAPGPVSAADLPTQLPSLQGAPASGGSGWNYQVSFYGWATSLTGEVGVGNLPTMSIDMPFSEVLKALDGALMGSVFANNGEWMVLADIVFAKISHKWSLDDFGGGELGASVTQTIASGAIGYMLQTGRPDLDVAVTSGLRYTSMKGSVSFNAYGLLPPRSVSQRQWWIDPTIGLFVHWDVNEKWFVNAIADIGGFGAGSKLSSTGYLGVGYMWSESFSTALGYRYLYEDYEAVGAGTGTFRYNATMHGPTLALAWRF